MKKKRVIFDYDYVKNFIEVESNSGCKLISKEYINRRQKLKIQCPCGEVFDRDFDVFKNKNLRTCKTCGKEKLRKLKAFTIENVKHFIEVESKSGCKLLSKTYKNNNTLLKIQCSCGNEFERRLDVFKAGSTSCLECSSKSRIEKSTFSYDYVKNFIEVESQSGCVLLSKEYLGASEKLSLKCKCGNIFEKTFNKFKNSYERNCLECSNVFYWDIETVKEFVEEEGCKLISEVFINVTEKMEFECSCGERFITTFQKYKDREKRQCNNCGTRLIAEKQSYSKEQVEQIMLKDGNKLISEYKNRKSFLDVQCSCGDVYQITLAYYLQGKIKCDKCVINSRRKRHYEKIKRYIEENSKSILLSEEYIHSKQPLLFKCECGETFEMCSHAIKSYKFFACESCRAEYNSSFGEKKISEVLDKTKASYLREYTFDDLKYQRELRFDFAVFENNILKCLIEYDGEGHYQPVKFGGIDEEKAIEILEGIKIRDEIKNNYCLENNIKLIRIPYWDYHNIEKILVENFVIPNQVNIVPSLGRNPLEGVETRTNELSQ